MAKRVYGIIFFICITVWVTGCAVPVKAPQDRIAELSQGYFQKGMHDEETGDRVAALRNYRLALTVDPKNQGAEEGLKRLERELRALAEQHCDSGKALQREGKYSQARKEFLIALRLWPDYGDAKEMLLAKKRVVIKSYVIHTIGPGDTLSKLALIYYGDSRKFPIIAKYNNISDATALRRGQELKIPEIQGLGFSAPKETGSLQETRDTESDYFEGEMSLGGDEDEGTREQTGPATTEEEVDQAAIYRDHGIELFKEKTYNRAIVEFDKVLAVNPEDQIALDYAYKCSFLQAVDLYEQKNYMAARDHFKTSIRYRKDCSQCHMYIENCESSYKEFHYNRGMQLYNMEQLFEAIKEWELVRKEDPGYKRVDYLIEKAQTILKNLNTLKGKEKTE